MSVMERFWALVLAVGGWTCLPAADYRRVKGGGAPSPAARKGIRMETYIAALIIGAALIVQALLLADKWRRLEEQTERLEAARRADWREAFVYQQEHDKAKGKPFDLSALWPGKDDKPTADEPTETPA